MTTPGKNRRRQQASNPGQKLPEKAARLLNKVPGIAQDELTGRTSELSALRRGLDRSGSLLLHGPGGIGKTSLASRYVQSFGQEYDHIAWLEQYDSLPATLMADTVLQDRLGIRPMPGELASQFSERLCFALRQLPGRNLLVIDNAEKCKSLLPPGPHWQLLLCSRQELPGFEPMTLGCLAAEAALELFRRNCRQPVEEDGLAALLELLGHHPLLTVLAARSLGNRPDTATPAALLASLQARPATDELLQYREEGEQEAGETATRLTQFLQALEWSGIPENPGLLRRLVQMAVLPPRATGYTRQELMAWLRIDKQRHAAARQLQELCRSGWLSQPRQEAFSMPPILGEALLQAHPPDEADLSALVNSFEQRFRLGDYDNPGECYSWLPLAQSLLRAADHLDFPDKALLENNAGIALLEMGEAGKAARLFERSLISNELNLGPDHPDLARSYYNLSCAFLQQFRVCKSAEMMEKALRSLEVHRSPDDPMIRRFRSELAALQIELGEPARARALLEANLDWNLRYAGLDDPETAQCYADLAHLLKNEDNNAEARKLYERALALDEQNLGPGHPVLANRCRDLARLLEEAGDLAGAAALYHRALVLSEQHKGPHHDGTVLIRDNIIHRLEQTGDLAGARQQYEIMLALEEQHYGPDSPGATRSRSRLADLLLRMGDTAAAEALLERAANNPKQGPIPTPANLSQEI